MPAFTPKKWWFIFPSNEAPEVIDSENRRILRMAPRESCTEMKANARLIATAPEMYRAIRDLLNDETFKNESMRSRLSKLIDCVDGKLPYKMWSEIFEDLGRTVRLREDD